MKFFRSVLVAIATLGLALPAAAVDAPESSDSGVHLLTSQTAAVASGAPSWIALNWTAAGGEATSFRLTANSPQITIAYPENTADHSSFYRDDTLSESELDYTALNLSLPAGSTGPVTLDLTVTYDWNGQSVSENLSVEVPVAGYQGGSIEALTDDVGTVDAVNPTWVELFYTAADLDVYEVAVTAEAAGFEVAYPADADSAGLASDSVLSVGETDVARVRLDASGAGDGDHVLVVTVSHAGGTVSHEVAVTVTGSAVDEPEQENPPADQPGDETDPRAAVTIADTNSEWYWWLDSRDGGTGAWRASVSFENDWIRHHYLTLQVTKALADGSTKTDKVRSFYVPAQGNATYVAWNNDLVIDGSDRSGVVSVEVEVLAVRTADEEWQSIDFEVDGPGTVVEAPAPRR